MAFLLLLTAAPQGLAQEAGPSGLQQSSEAETHHYGKHHQVNHSKSYVDKRTKNHINGIEGFWSYAKHILYNYRGVSKYHFPMYLKEIEYRFNHRGENLFKQFIKLYFGYDSP